jgi:hypothetical protein
MKGPKPARLKRALTAVKNKADTAEESVGVCSNNMDSPLTRLLTERSLEKESGEINR